MNQKHPRVAIVSSNPLRDDASNGIFLRSLFRGWPRDKLSQVYFRVLVPHLPNGDDCGEYRVIGITGRARRVESMDSVRPSRPVELSLSPKTQRRQAVVGQLKRRVPLFRGLRWVYERWSAQPWMGRALARQLRSLRPDIVYALLGTYALTKNTVIACQSLRIPLFVHVTDDFVTAAYKGMPFASRIQADSERWFQRAVDYADGLAGISPLMADVYSRRYGKKWDWFTTLIDASAYDPTPRAPDGAIRLVYAGNLGLGRWESLRTIATALLHLKQRNGIESSLLIYSSPEQLKLHREALEIPPITEIRGWAPPEHLPQIFHDADVLIHVESDDPEIVEYTRLSFSTKLSQYMMAGRCILAFGPDQLGSIRIVRDVAAGFSISTDGPELEASLEKLLVDSGTRQEKGRNGRAWAVRNVERHLGQQRFRQGLLEVLRRSRVL